MMNDLVTALALVLVIEGLMYAVFPEQMKRMIVAIMSVPAGTLRMAGLAAAVVGVGIVWLIRG